jgi:hypothetical protein
VEDSEALTGASSCVSSATAGRYAVRAKPPRGSQADSEERAVVADGVCTDRLLDLVTAHTSGINSDSRETAGDGGRPAPSWWF